MTVGLWAVVIVAAVGAFAAILLVVRPKRTRPVVLEGAVIRHASQAERQQPLSDVVITAREGSVTTSTQSDPSGFFRLVLPLSGSTSRPVLLEFRLPGYQPLDLPVIGGGRLYVTRLIPTPSELETQPDVPQVKVSNVSVRYSVKTTEAANIGSAVRTFQVVNTANVPCNHYKPCSPDGRWKAATGSVVMDAGEGNEFRNVRVSCIAGPCSFTRIAPEDVPTNVRILRASALNWSDTATFLVEAEVVHPMYSAELRKSYPVMFGRVLDFTLPASAEGVTLEADLGGNHIMFPLGPRPVVSWAACQVRVNLSKSKVFRCELTPGYRF
ncbi:MAG TPA: carboxypeptidase regulatory-like domain-containing protein [Terriglobia bacterium]|nr:carboxypeptidase regulatory-like domain-containing protein [Terriglobia bacterium]